MKKSEVFLDLASADMLWKNC